MPRSTRSLGGLLILARQQSSTSGEESGALARVGGTNVLESPFGRSGGASGGIMMTQSRTRKSRVNNKARRNLLVSNALVRPKQKSAQKRVVETKNPDVHYEEGWPTLFHHADLSSGRQSAIISGGWIITTQDIATLMPWNTTEGSIESTVFPMTKTRDTRYTSTVSNRGTWPHRRQRAVRRKPGRR